MGGGEGAPGHRDRFIITVDPHCWTARHGKAVFLQLKTKTWWIFFFNLEKQGEK